MPLFRLILVLCAAMIPAWAGATAPQLELAAQAYVIGNPATGKILAEKNADMLIQPASLTKLMTAYMLFDALKQGTLTLDSTLPVSEAAWRKEGSKMFVEVGKTARIAEYLGGTEAAFAQTMTNRAEGLGLTNTIFKNSTGWPDEGHLTTAKDMFILASRLIRDFPEYYSYFGQPGFTYSGISQPNRNGLLFQNVGVDGMKTGHTDDSGYHLLASAQRQNQRYIAVVMGTKGFQDREAEALKGLNWAFANFRERTLIQAQQVVKAEAPTWLATQPTVPLLAAQDVKALFGPGQGEGVKATLIYAGPIAAPLAAGSEVGFVQITDANGTELGRTPVLTGAALVAQTGLGTWFQKLAYRFGF